MELKLDGKGGGCGKYSYRNATIGRFKVSVFNMPEDDFYCRIVFSHGDEVNIPIIKIPKTQAQLLWVTLNAMAKDLEWKDDVRTT